MHEIIAKIAYSAVAVLVAVLAVYLAVRLISKLAKFLVVVAAAVVIGWLILANREIFSFLPNLWRDIREVFGAAVTDISQIML